jgi:hypothetical protein
MCVAILFAIYKKWVMRIPIRILIFSGDADSDPRFLIRRIGIRRSH